ncbi:hypothetical protein HK096_002877 [Nowakowskiella sp. JEL0078]|nr:hypothetical protein HK096_002877 [Nowakowskiella sp. JEL0078]
MGVSDVIHFIGSKWNFAESPFKVYLSMIFADISSGELIPDVKLLSTDDAASSNVGEQKTTSKTIVNKRAKKIKKIKTIQNVAKEDELRTKVAVQGKLKCGVTMRVDKLSRKSFICDEVNAQKPREIVTCCMKGLYVSLSDSKGKNYDLILTVSENCITSGTLVGLFNRIRSQTISTKYLSVPSTLDRLEASRKKWDAFIIWLVDDPDLDINLVGSESPIQKERLQTLGRKIDRLRGSNNSLIAKLPYEAPNESDNQTQSSNTENNFINNTAESESSMKMTSDTTIFYGDVIVLEHILSGLLTKPMRIRKVVDTSNVIIHPNEESATREPVSQLQKVAFEILDSPGSYLSFDEESMTVFGKIIESTQKSNLQLPLRKPESKPIFLENTSQNKISRSNKNANLKEADLEFSYEEDVLESIEETDDTSEDYLEKELKSKNKRAKKCKKPDVVNFEKVNELSVLTIVQIGEMNLNS